MKWFDDIKKYYVFRALVKRFALPVIVLYMVDSGLSLQQIAVLTAVSSIILLIFEIPSGALADAMGHKRALTISMIGQAISMALFLGGSFWWIISAVSLYWLSGTLLTGTSDALFYERLKVLERASEYKKLSGKATSFAQFIGILFMALAGVLYMIHPWIPFIVGTVQFLLAAFLITSFGKTRENSVGKFEVAMVWENIAEATALMRKYKDIFWIVIAHAVVVGASFVLFEYEQVIMDELGVVAAGIGFAYSGKRLIGAIAPLSVSVIEKFLSDKVVMVLGLISVSVLFVATSFASSVIFFILGVYAMTAITIVGKIIQFGYVNDRIKTNARATVLSFYSLIMGVVKASGLLILGATLNVVDLHLALGLIAGAVCLLMILIFTPSMIRTVK